MKNTMLVEGGREDGNGDLGKIINASTGGKIKKGEVKRRTLH